MRPHRELIADLQFVEVTEHLTINIVVTGKHQIALLVGQVDQFGFLLAGQLVGRGASGGRCHGIARNRDQGFANLGHRCHR